MTPLTDKQYEVAARWLCDALGVDPDASACGVMDGEFSQTNLQLFASHLHNKDLETIALAVGRQHDP